MAAKQLIDRALLVCALGLGLSTGCGAEEVHVTELVLLTDSDFPYTDLAHLTLEATENGERHVLYDIEVTSATAWPATFGLVHKGGTLGSVTATIKASLRAPRQNEVLTRTQVANFVANKTLVVPLYLSAGCFSPGDPSTFVPSVPPCSDDLQCSEGEPMCIDKQLGELDSWPVPQLDKGESILGGDGGVGDGDGDGDGGLDDGGSMPGSDAGTDAGPTMLCDGTPTEILTDPQHCGSCDRDCTSNSGSNPNFTGSCHQGVCECQLGFKDCNPNDQDQACSVQLGTKTNCADCGDKCTGQKECIGGLCKVP